MIRLSGLVNIPALSEEKGEKWIQQAIKKPGALRNALKVKAGKNIPAMAMHEDVNTPDGMQDEKIDDHEGSMAKADLLSIHKKAGELYNMISEDEELEGWVQAKITKAAEYINAVHNNMQYEKTKPNSIGNGEMSPADKTEPTMAESVEPLEEKAPEGWKATVERMKKHKEIDNPFALAHWMASRGYRPHKKSKK